MLSVTGSATADREFVRRPRFFEPLALSLAALLISLAITDWPLLSLVRPAALAALLLAWGWLRLRPLASFATERRPAVLHRRPLLTMVAGASLVLTLALTSAIVLWGGWRSEGAAVILLIAVAGGLPLGAAFWEDRFGRGARLARRRARGHHRAAS